MLARTKELRQLKDLVLRMAAMVEKSIDHSIKSLVDRDSDLAASVVEGDKEINAVDVKIEQECLKLLALSQPMASDLRFITTAMKITTDMERIGDNAVNIAERALELNQEPPVKPYIDIPYMSRIARGMVRDSIDAFVNGDKKLAVDVIMRDDEVDDINDAIIKELVHLMQKRPEIINNAIKISYISRYIERIADHATNIAEMVIFMVEGKIVRHMDLHMGA